jgi:hypothetical protein
MFQCVVGKVTPVAEFNKAIPAQMESAMRVPNEPMGKVLASVLWVAIPTLFLMLYLI